MKKSDELKITRQQKIDAMQAIVDKATNENKRSLTDDEQTSYTTLKGEVINIERQITDAEFLETRSQDSDDNNDPTQFQQPKNFQIKRSAKPYSVGKAIREFYRGGTDKLTGIEAESHQELSRHIISEGLLVPYHNRDQNTTSNADSIDVVIDPRLSIIGKEPLYQQMGLTVLPGLQGTLKIGKKTVDEAEKYSEKSEITKTANVPEFETMAPERYGITDIFTKELLAQENPAVHAAIINDMIKGCDRKLTADVYTVALDTATEVAAGALTVAGFNALMAAIDIDGAFAMDRGSFFEAKGVKVDTGSGMFLASMGANNGVGRTYDGASIFYSNLFADGANKQYGIYGAWSEIWLGFWGALEVLTNPFTYQKKGQIEMTVNRLADIVCRNDDAFVRTPDLDATT